MGKFLNCAEIALKGKLECNCVGQGGPNTDVLCTRTMNLR